MGLHEIPIANPFPSTTHPPIPSASLLEIPQHPQGEFFFKSIYRCKNLITFYQNMDSFHFQMEQGIPFHFMTASTKANAAFLTSSIDSLRLLFVINSNTGDTGSYSSPFLLNGPTIHPDKIPFLQLTGQPSPTPRPPPRCRLADSHLAFNAHNWFGGLSEPQQHEELINGGASTPRLWP